MGAQSEADADKVEFQIHGPCWDMDGKVYLTFPDGSSISIQWPQGHPVSKDAFAVCTFREGDKRGWRSVSPKRFKER